MHLQQKSSHFQTPMQHPFNYGRTRTTNVVRISSVKFRDDTQESLDLDRIDLTRVNNRLSTTTIARTRLNSTVYKVYDAAKDLSVCFDVPSGLYIEFGFVRVRVSASVSYERIVAVKVKYEFRSVFLVHLSFLSYTFSNWRFECLRTSCNDDSTDQFPVTFQASFVDYTKYLSLLLKFLLF